MIARGELDNALKMAWVSSQVESDSRDYPPPELVKSLDKAIRKTKTLLREVEKHLRTRRIAFDFCRSVKGQSATRNLLARRGSLRALLEDRVDPNASVAAINIYRVSDRLQRKIGIHRGPGEGKAVAGVHPRKAKRLSLLMQQCFFESILR